MTYCPTCWRRYRVPGTCTDCGVTLEVPTSAEVRLELIRRITQEAGEAMATCRSRKHHQHLCPNCNARAASALDDMRRLLPTRS